MAFVDTVHALVIHVFPWHIYRPANLAQPTLHMRSWNYRNE